MTRAGETIAVELRANGIADVAAAEVGIQFDSSLVRCTGISAGPLFGPGATFQQNVDNNGGVAAFLVKGTPANNGQAIAILRFQAVQRGMAPLSIVQFTLQNSSGKTLSASPVNGVIEVK